MVTFSTSEECQNFYFTEGVRAKMELVGDRLDFEWDPTFRKEILRVVDSEFLMNQKRRTKEEQEKPKREHKLGLN